MAQIARSTTPHGQPPLGSPADRSLPGIGWVDFGFRPLEPGLGENVTFCGSPGVGGARPCAVDTTRLGRRTAAVDSVWTMDACYCFWNGHADLQLV